MISIAGPLGIKLTDGTLGDAEARSMAEQFEGSGPFWIERAVWLSLFEASRLSIKHCAAIHFG